MARLGDVCTLVNGYAFKPSDWSDTGLPIIRIQNLNDERAPFNYYKGEIESKYLVNSGDLLFAWSGTPGTSFGAFFWNRGRGVLNQHIFNVFPDASLYKPYLRYALNGNLNQIISKAHGGVGLQHITKKELVETVIRVPPMPEQKRIANVLDRVFNLISLRKQQLAKLDELVKSRFVELFGDPMTNSKGYVLKKYGDLFELNAGGTPPRQKTEYWDNGTISWIGSNMCQNTAIYENDGNYITEEGLKHSSARMFPVDTVLIALVGATIGKTALLKFETTTNQNVLGVRGIRENGYTPEFLFYYTQGLYQKFLNIGDGGFSMASKGFISELPVPVVNLALQEQFSAIVKQINKSKLAVQQSLDKLELLKKALMQKYFG